MGHRLGPLRLLLSLFTTTLVLPLCFGLPYPGPDYVSSPQLADHGLRAHVRCRLANSTRRAGYVVSEPRAPRHIRPALSRLRRLSYSVASSQLSPARKKAYLPDRRRAATGSIRVVRDRNRRRWGL